MIGKSILHYEVLSQLGAGGMGVVYEARDSRLGRMVALKVLTPEKSRDPKRRQRFLREARAAAALNHPNIVSVYDIGADRGTDFLAMELVRGSTLDALLKRGLLPIADVLAYGSQIANAIAAAHAAGVVHRDLKPGNIMITGDGAVKLLDFGLAQLNPLLAVAEAETISVLTEAGATLGTVQYMSPEQARGEAVDERSDVFSFGVVLYEMAGGARPFQAASTFGFLHAIAYSEPKPLADCRSEIPPEVCEVISKCLRKDRETRYQRMDEVAAALTQLRGSAASASSPSVRVPPRGRTTPNWKRYTWVPAALAAAGLLFALSPAGRNSWHNLRSSGFAISTQAPVDAPEWVRRGHALLFRYDKAGNVDKAIESFQNALRQDPDNAAAYAGLGEAYAQKYAQNQDAQWLRMGLSNASRAVQLNDLLADAHVSAGQVNVRAGKFQDAEHEFRRALELEPGNADAQLRLGESLAGEGRSKEAEASYQSLIQTHPEDWRPYHFLGALLFQNARYSEAIPRFEKAAQLAPDNPAIYRILGSTYHMLDQDGKAVEMLQRALAIRPTPYVLTNLGQVYFDSGRYLDAASAFQRAIATGANDALLWANLGDAYRFTPGNEAQAKDAYQEAIRLLKIQISARSDKPGLACTMAGYLAKSGDNNAAWDAVQRYRGAPKLEAVSLYRLGVASELTGHREAALELLRRAVQSGLGVREIQTDPDLIALRSDPSYHRVVLPRTGSEQK